MRSDGRAGGPLRLRLDSEIFRVDEEGRVPREREPETGGRDEARLPLDGDAADPRRVQGGSPSSWNQTYVPPPPMYGSNVPSPNGWIFASRTTGIASRMSRGDERGSGGRDRAALPRVEPRDLERHDPRRADIQEDAAASAVLELDADVVHASVTVVVVEWTQVPRTPISVLTCAAAGAARRTEAEAERGEGGLLSWRSPSRHPRERRAARELGWIRAVREPHREQVDVVGRSGERAHAAGQARLGVDPEGETSPT